MQVYSAYLIVLHKFSTFNMNALSLPSQRAKKVRFEKGKGIHFLLIKSGM